MSAAPTMAPALPFGQAAEHLKVKLRPDLVVQPQFYEGMTHYVVKDPLALKYFRFKIEEYFLLQQFDGKQTLQEVKKAFERKYRPQTISIEDLTRFVAQLHEAGIIQIDSADQAKVLIRRRKKNRWRKIWAFLANILFIKIPIIDPERLLTRMYPYFRWIFTRTFVTLSLMSMLAGRLPGHQPVEDLLRQAARFPELLQLVDHLQLLGLPGGREDHPRVRPRPDRQAFRRRSPRDGNPLPRPHPGPLLRRDR